MEPVIDQPRQIAKVRHVSDDRTAVYLELRSGLTATFTSGSPVNLCVGDVVFINSEGNNVELAPRELWREETWIGVVRLLKADRIVVDVSGRLRVWPRPSILDLKEGNTVEGLDSLGITGILSDKPVRYIDFTAEESVTAEYFKQQPSDSPSFDDFGGFREIVDRAQELIELPLQRHDALMKIGARPIKGVLFTGESGTGKTMLARIVANNAGAQFYEIGGPQVLSKWYGQSEELIRKIFEDAAKQERAIVFFDEIDSLAAQRRDESHEASRRVVGQLLTSMDGFKPETNVVVVATTNRPQDIDIALRRPGRFDWEIHFPLPSREDREAILISSVRKLSVEKDLPHALIAEKTDSWSPAELAAIWSEAALLAVRDQREIILEEDYLGGFERVAAQRSRVATSRRTERQETAQ
jgi:transitional endoplasmic reticulum ATPase